MSRAQMLVLPEFLEKLLEFPVGVQIEGAEMVQSGLGQRILLTVVGDDLPDGSIVVAEYSEKSTFDRFDETDLVVVDGKLA